MVLSPKQAGCVTCTNQHRGNRVYSDPQVGYALSSVVEENTCNTTHEDGTCEDP